MEVNVSSIVEELIEHSSEKYKANVIKLGIPSKNTIGVSTADLRKLAKKISKNKEYLQKLWQTDYHECKILSVLAIKPEDCDNQMIQVIMNGVNSWDLCDLFCKTILIKKSNFDDYINNWIEMDDLFYKRAAFTLIASTSTHASLSIEEIQKYLGLIEENSDDDRLLIKKAASWALRELGKTNEEAKVLSIKIAKEMLEQNLKAKQWVAKDALKELETLVKVEGRNRLISSKSKMGQQISK